MTNPKRSYHYTIPVRFLYSTSIPLFEPGLGMVRILPYIGVIRVFPHFEKILECLVGKEQDSSYRADDHEQEQHWRHLGGGDFIWLQLSCTGGGRQ